MANPDAGPDPSPPRSTRSTVDADAFSRLALVLLALRVAFVAARVLHGPVADQTLQRFMSIATSPGVPYRDFPVEYGPIDTALISFIAGSGYAALWTRIHVVAMCADIATWYVIVRYWGGRAGTTYLLLGLPLIWLCYARLDLVSVLLATLGAAWVSRYHQRRGGLTVAVASLSKLWPLAIVPIVWGAGARRAAWWAIAGAGLGTVFWICVTTPSAPIQVMSFRGATGWSVESTGGTVLWSATDRQLRNEQGSQRVGEIAPWQRWGLAVILSATLTGIARKVRRTRFELAGGACLAAVAAVLACSTLSSLQYACWMLPWAAVGSSEPRPARQRIAVVTVIGAASTLGFLTATGAPTPVFKVLLVTRAVATVATVATWTGWRRHTSAAVETFRPLARA